MRMHHCMLHPTAHGDHPHSKTHACWLQLEAYHARYVSVQ